jgi:hypothetical protein
MVVVVVDEHSVCLLTMSNTFADSVPVQFRQGEFLHSGGI